MLCGCIYLTPLLALGPYFYDRYLLLTTILFILGVVGLTDISTSESTLATRGLRVTGFAVLGALAVFSVCGTRDLLAWNRVRWYALTELMLRDHVSAEQTDGGYEFNGPRFYDPSYSSPDGKSWWWIKDDLYMIGFDVIPGYRIIREYHYAHWLPPHKQRVIVMKRE